MEDRDRKKKGVRWTGDSLIAGWIFKETSVKKGLKLPIPIVMAASVL